MKAEDRGRTRKWRTPSCWLNFKLPAGHVQHKKKKLEPLELGLRWSRNDVSGGLGDRRFGIGVLGHEIGGVAASLPDLLAGIVPQSAVFVWANDAEDDVDVIGIFY